MQVKLVETKPVKLYINSSSLKAKNFMIRIMRQELNKFGLEGIVGDAIITHRGKNIEMAYVEYLPPEEWDQWDVEYVNNRIGKVLGPWEQCNEKD